MQGRPLIQTAIPKRRYRIGGYVATLLGEIESKDGRRYRYLLAFVPEGASEPVLYVCSESSPSAERATGAYRLSLISESLNEFLDCNDRWGEIEPFAEQGLRLGCQVLGLPEGAISRLL
ncbi:hypothetical protein GWK36_09100 [Caldichromatium japonicum]|uniref:Uncharacterized protein n=1 Tax=Caldichromatium japonicum TaxID=2699430 RepID=A0A6G7VE97_9GAMM|nr:hypothetical protein [Caldichromatium japonicum]QIK38117.1 hypothetical protein GWK36_09100 [Caldichromatium japonicum]